MLDIIYYLIIGPIEMLVEITYCIMHRILGSTGIAIIAVSFVIQTMVLPLYKRADKLQDEERNRQRDMSFWVNHIKKSFKGDERFMMLSAYYKEKNYKQWYAIISSSSILLQIPFFIAAYHFLSNLNELSGQSFLFIKDLSQPDMAVSLAGLSINILPILMTLINICSGIVYTRSLPLREKIQIYGLALLFLIILYNSPSGLVLYWTMNNLYSLGKNVVMKMLNISSQTNERESEDNLSRNPNENRDMLLRLFLMEALFLSLFIGALIPLNIVSSSATEFINTLHGPIYLTICNLAVYVGIFLLWGGIFFAFMSVKLRRYFVTVMTILCGVVIVDYMVFSRDLGLMSPLMGYYNGLMYNTADKILNFIVLLIIMVILAKVVSSYPKVILRIIPIMIVSVVVLCVVNGMSVGKQVRAYNKRINSQNESEQIETIKFSKNGTNVIVLMMDRAISGFIPYIFNENPEIAALYDGFTYYPNTLSFGTKTIFGAPALFGGYDYTPKEINERNEELLKDKNNEALLLMPKLFSENGYDVTVVDPPFAGTYSYDVDYSMYYELKNTKVYGLYDKFLYEYAEKLLPSYQKRQESLMKYYSVMKILPLAVQKYAYSEGGYFSKVDFALNMEFLKAYSVLLKMNEITEFSDDGSKNFLLFQNESTHSIAELKMPEYEPVEGVQNKDIDYTEYFSADKFTVNGRTLKICNSEQAQHYQCTVASLRRLGMWFEYLKENDCWDNTRIIVVSDHGHPLGNFEDMVVDETLDIEAYNPLLMVKDFGDREYKVSDEYMTNADVPELAFAGLINDPINPFTGNYVNDERKTEEQLVTTSRQWNPDPTAYTFDNDDATWYCVTPGNVFDPKNWSKVGE